MLVCLLVVPSLYLIEKYLGLLAIVPYVGLVVAAVAAWRSRWSERLIAALGERRARALGALTFVAIAGSLAVVHSLAHGNRFGGGSDSGEALVQATTALLHGRYPYLERTFLGNPISPMPGSLLMAAPFVAVGAAAYQSLVWLAIGALLLRRAWGGDTARTLLFVWLVLAVCPAVLHRLSIGSDYPANCLMVLATAVMLLRSAAGSERWWPAAGWALALGVSLSSRANFVFVVPLVASRLVQLREGRRGLALTAISSGTAAAMTLPFWLGNRAGFSPLHTLNKLAEVEGALPHARVIIPVLAAVLTLALARPRWNGSLAAFLRNAAVVQAVLVVSRALLWWLSGRDTVFGGTAFAQFFFYFGLGGWALGVRAAGQGLVGAGTNAAAVVVGAPAAEAGVVDAAGANEPADAGFAVRTAPPPAAILG